MQEELLRRVAEEAWRGEARVAIINDVNPLQWEEIERGFASGWWRESGICRLLFRSWRSWEWWFLPHTLRYSLLIFSSPSAVAFFTYSPAADFYHELYLRVMVKKMVLEEGRGALGREAADAIRYRLYRDPKPLFGPPVRVPLERGLLGRDGWHLVAHRLDVKEGDPELLLDLFTLGIYIACLYAFMERVTPFAYKRILARTLVNREDRAWRGERPPPLKRRSLALLHLLEVARREGVQLPRAIRACYAFRDEVKRTLCLEECDRFAREHPGLLLRICANTNVWYLFPAGSYTKVVMLNPITGLSTGVRTENDEKELAKVLEGVSSHSSVGDSKR